MQIVRKKNQQQISREPKTIAAGFFQHQSVPLKTTILMDEINKWNSQYSGQLDNIPILSQKYRTVYKKKINEESRHHAQNSQEPEMRCVFFQHDQCLVQKDHTDV